MVDTHRTEGIAISRAKLVPQTIRSTCVITARTTPRFDNGRLGGGATRQAIVPARVVAGRARPHFCDGWFCAGRGGGAVVPAGVIAAWTGSHFVQGLLCMAVQREEHECHRCQRQCDDGASRESWHVVSPKKTYLALDERGLFCRQVRSYC